MGNARSFEQPMSVCNFAGNVRTLDGQVVKVRGIVQVFSPARDEFYVDSMIGNSCPGSRQNTVKVRISYPDSHFLENPPTGYKVDRASFSSASRIIREAQGQGKPVDPLLATIEGVAYAPGPNSTQKGTTARPKHGTYDGTIMIQAIRDVQVIGK
jgi:hypothetical protein